LKDVPDTININKIDFINSWNNLLTMIKTDFKIRGYGNLLNLS